MSSIIKLFPEDTSLAANVCLVPADPSRRTMYDVIATRVPTSNDSTKTIVRRSSEIYKKLGVSMGLTVKRPKN